MKSWQPCVRRLVAALVIAVVLFSASAQAGGSKKCFVAYWLNCELTGGGGFACPPLAAMAEHQRPDGSPEIDVVPLFAASFRGTTTDFQPPYLTFPPSLVAAMQSDAVALLQSQGIKVILSILGNGEEDGVGWSSIPPEHQESFARWLKQEIVEKYGLDGIDIDDEYAGNKGTPQQLVDTLAWMRSTLPQAFFSKALWRDYDAFEAKAQIASQQGKTLAEMLDLGCTMAYGWSERRLRSAVSRYAERGLPKNKICIGVQAGPDVAWMTSLETTRALARWVKTSDLRGMMIYSYSQDIENFVFEPQRSKPYPADNDHQWQRAIMNILAPSEITSVKREKNIKTVRVLTIGNSFAQNACRYLAEIAESSDSVRVVIGTANIGGCSLEKHWTLAHQAASDPTLKPYTHKRGGGSAKMNIQECLEAEPWDYVTLQQLSNLSFKPESFDPYAENLAALIKTHAPQAKLLIHETWAYRPDSPVLREEGLSQQGMYERLSQAYASLSQQLQARVIPVGTAFQRARSAVNREVVFHDPEYDYQHPVFPHLPKQTNSLVTGWTWRHRDGQRSLALDFKHANAKGCYLAGLVWYAVLTGDDARMVSFLPDGMTAEDGHFLRQVAHDTLNPRRTRTGDRRRTPPDEWTWVNPEKIDACTHGSLMSPSMKREIGYNVYLPPTYVTEPGRRYPVVYYLHGASGTETSAKSFAWAVQGAIQAQAIGDVIYVFPNGGQYSGYRDRSDGSVMAETWIIKELIPHIDKTYRTIDSREGRSLCGWSMGGGGSLRFVMKYPQLFCAAATMAAAVGMGNRDNTDDTALTHLEKNADFIRGKTGLWMAVGAEDSLMKRNQVFSDRLTQLNIAHTFHTVPEVGHNLGELNKRFPREIVVMLAQHYESAR